MEDSFLFAGLKFDRKRFADDINRFKPCKLEDEQKKIEERVTVELPKEVIKTNKKSDQQAKLKKILRKRKRNEKSSIIGTIDGFSVFKGAKSMSKADKKSDNSSLDELKKEERRQIEQNLEIRKKYGIHVSNSNLPAPLQHFVELGSRYGCKPYLLRNFAELGYKEPTPIQRQIIPLLLSGLQCFACAPTGSGKTLAFLCPIIMKTKPGSKDGIKAVILCPTRELAAQTTRECKKLTNGRKFHIRCMTKELSRTGDFKNLNCDIIVSTPVRLEYAMRKRKLDLSRVEFLVLDEADKLFELGYIEQIDKISHACSNDSVVRALFSATLPEYVEEFARTKMLDAVRVIVGKKNTAAALIKQKLIYVGSETGKLIALRQSFAESLNPPILIFVQSKERAKQLHKELACEDLKVDLIHADRSQEERESAVDNFRGGKTWVLIATDVIARGMDFKGVNCVINYDFPDSAAAYIHRIGRCGRAGRSGEAITLYTEEDKPFLRNIANVMAESGCEVPAWMLKMPKLRKKKHRPERETISTKAEEDVSD